MDKKYPYFILKNLIIFVDLTRYFQDVHKCAKGTSHKNLIKFI